ncbi:glycosyltransferase [Marixanthomonas sp. SCSIO 43207]|uniref:glycosyltransferase n=1 Tax=Marixanthomonas sp. SCSIO 43207 TaxID=2779360 RepID=UPI001CA8B4CA|nr:glycosyltransferase [Marixanthomonas sp. SCSIO 43207]UAB80434.1 glycosyltransferase [Marixanthomonas sp. SCSIO 43207]
MKIFFPLGAFYPSQIGGPCNTLYWHCSALKNNDIEPAIITTMVGIKVNIKANEWLKLNCGDVFYGKKGVTSLKTRKRLSKEISKTDILHLNSLFSPFSIYSFLYCSLFDRNKKIIWSVRGELNKNALKFSTWKKKPLLSLYKSLNRNVVYHSTSSEETKSIQKIFPKNKIVEIPNLIAPSERLNLKNSENLLYVGRIHPIKSLDKIIEALALSETFLKSSSKFFIVGKQEERHNSYKEKLVSLINKLNLQNKIVFKGHLEGVKKEKIYAESFALILASETENFGNVVVESLNQGTPVIASKGTPWKILEDYKAGIHVSNDPKTLSKAIDSLLSLNFKEYQEMRKNSYKLIDEMFKIDLQIHIWIDIYKSLLNEN